MKNLSNANNLLFSSLSQFFELCGAGGGVVYDIGDDEVRLLDRPFILIVDLEAFWDDLDTFGQHGVEVIGRLKSNGFKRLK